MIIQHVRELEAFCHAVPEGAALFLDTEFVSEGRYHPDVGAIQVGTREQAVLVDPLAVRDMAPLFALLVDPTRVKVFHAGDQDLGIFFRLMGEPVTPVFDVQVAAALLGYGEQISFANLVEKLAGVHLQKGHGFTDWLRRPLSDGQVEYALDDVRYLVPVYDKIVAELTTRGRLAWAQEEFRPLSDTARYQEADPRELYLRIRGADRMSGQTLAVLRELVAWREETARAENVSVTRIGRDEVMVELARRPRQSVKELYEIRGLQPQQVNRYGQAMLEVCRHGTKAPRPTVRRHETLPTSLEPTVDFLALCLRSLAGERKLSPGIVATRGDLAALIMAGERADVPVMRGWRREAIGNALLDTLNGRATARIIPGSRQVHLEWHGEGTQG